MKDMCRGKRIFEFQTVGYFIWKQGCIFPSICSCIILAYFSNYGNRTRKVPTAVHILTIFLKKKSNKLVVCVYARENETKTGCRLLCASSLWHISFPSFTKIIWKSVTQDQLKGFGRELWGCSWYQSIVQFGHQRALKCSSNMAALSCSQRVRNETSVN